MIDRVTREVKNTIMVAEDKIGDMNLVPDKPRSLKLSQPGHLRSINIQFDPQAPTIIPVTIPKKKSSDNIGFMLPMAIPFVMPTSPGPVPPTAVKPAPVKPPPSTPIQPKPIVEPKLTPRNKQKPQPVPKTQQIPKTQQVLTPKPQTIPTPKTEPKPKTIPKTVPKTEPKPKTIPKTEPNPRIPETKPKTKPQPKPRIPGPSVSPPTQSPSTPSKPRVTFKQIPLKTFELGSDGNMKFPSQLDRAVNRNLTQTSKQSLKLRPNRMPTGALRAATGVPAAVFFIGISELISNIRSDQVHEEQKRQVGLTHEFNKYFLEQIYKNPINDSEVMRLQMKESGMTGPGAITEPISKDQAYDILVTRKKRDILDKFYDDVYMPNREKDYMQSLLIDPNRSGIDDIKMRVLIKKYPEVYRKNHWMWTPRKLIDEAKDKPPVPGGLYTRVNTPSETDQQQINDVYNQVMLALNQPVIQSTETPVQNKPTVYKITDDYEDITFMNTDTA